MIICFYIPKDKNHRPYKQLFYRLFTPEGDKYLVSTGERNGFQTGKENGSQLGH
jgi:hypothetical protein